jgi:Cu(I)/Ag(I) efflux system membrane protein CusA/SilA
VASQVKLPAGYSLSWSGQYEYIQKANKSLALVVPVTIALIALMLYLAFRRISHVLIIMGTLPMALAGSFWLLYLLGYNMSVAVAVGLIALAGVTTEIGVILIVYLNHSVASYQEKCIATNLPLSLEGLRDAVRDGALLRLRPIAMTAVAIVSGLLPLMLGAGTGSEVMRRIAAPMVGGMISSLILTMLVIPAAYLLWEWHRLRKLEDRPVEVMQTGSSIED